MDIFGAKTRKLKQKINLIENNLQESFSKVRQEMDSVNAWLNYYYQRSLYFENQINQSAAGTAKLSKELSENNGSLDKHSKIISEITDNMEKIPKEISSLRDLAAGNNAEDRLNFYIEKISKEILKLDNKMESLSNLPSRIGLLREQLNEHISQPITSPIIEQRIAEIQERLKQIIIKKSPKDKLIQKVAKNSHDYIKAMIISYIKKYEKISAFQLREMVVEEQNLISKSTFYRIIEEIESMEEISTIRQGKEKIYLSKLKKPA